jgi:nitrate reductase gamma subunit
MEADKKNLEPIEHVTQKKRIVFYSVLSITIVIIALWGLAFRNRFSNFNWSASSENSLIKAAKNDLDQASEMIEKPIRDKAAARETVKNTLQTIFESAAASSSQRKTTSTAATSTN